MGAGLQAFPSTAPSQGTFNSPRRPTGFLWPVGHEGQQEAGGGCTAAMAPLGFQPWPGWAGRAASSTPTSPGTRDTPVLAPLQGGEEKRPCKDQVKP